MFIVYSYIYINIEDEILYNVKSDMFHLRWGDTKLSYREIEQARIFARFLENTVVPEKFYQFLQDLSNLVCYQGFVLAHQSTLKAIDPHFLGSHVLGLYSSFRSRLI